MKKELVILPGNPSAAEVLEHLMETDKAQGGNAAICMLGPDLLKEIQEACPERVDEYDEEGVTHLIYRRGVSLFGFLASDTIHLVSPHGDQTYYRPPADLDEAAGEIYQRARHDGHTLPKSHMMAEAGKDLREDQKEVFLRLCGDAHPVNQAVEATLIICQQGQAQ